MEITPMRTMEEVVKDARGELSPSSLSVLGAILAVRDKKGLGDSFECPNSELVTIVNLSAANVNRVLSRLEQHGTIRRRHVNGRRVIEIVGPKVESEPQLTSEVREELTANGFVSIPRAAFDLEGITPENLAVLAAMLFIAEGKTSCYAKRSQLAGVFFTPEAAAIRGVQFWLQNRFIEEFSSPDHASRRGFRFLWMTDNSTQDRASEEHGALK